MAVEIKEFRTPSYDQDAPIEGYCFRCTTTGLVFGPTLESGRGDEDAEAFLQFLLERHSDPRAIPPRELAEIYHAYCAANIPF